MLAVTLIPSKIPLLLAFFFRRNVETLRLRGQALLPIESKYVLSIDGGLITNYSFVVG